MLPTKQTSPAYDSHVVWLKVPEQAGKFTTSGLLYQHASLDKHDEHWLYSSKMC